MYRQKELRGSKLEVSLVESEEESKEGIDEAGGKEDERNEG